MGLYVVEHRHDADRCPAGDPKMAPFLLRILSPAAARDHGITIHAEAVERGAHHLYVVVDAANEQAVRDYLAPFGKAGTLRIVEASPCEEVVRRGAC
jgi:hypothetical protein